MVMVERPQRTAVTDHSTCMATARRPGGSCGRSGTGDRHNGTRHTTTGSGTGNGTSNGNGNGNG